MKKRNKSILILLVVMVCMLICVPFAALAETDTEWDYSTELANIAENGDNGASSTYRGMTINVGIYNQNFWRGTDVDGNFFMQPMQEVSGGPGNGTRFTAVSDRKMYLDGFTVRFRLDQLYANHPVKNGANWSIGLGVGPNTTAHAWMHSGLTVMYNEANDNFDFYFTSANNNFWPLPLGGETVGIEIGQYALPNGDEEFVRPGFGDDILFQIRKLTKEEAAARGITATVNPYAYYLFINNHIIAIPQRGTNTPGLEAFLPNWTGQLPLPSDAQGDYGYFWYYDNVMSNNGAGNPVAKPEEGAKGARITFYEIQGNGSDGGELYDGDVTPLTGFSGDGYLHSTPIGGRYQGKTTLVAKTDDGFDLTQDTAADLSGAEIDFAVMPVGNSPLGSKAQVLLRGTDKSVGLSLTRRASGLQVDLLADGVSYPTQYTEAAPFVYGYEEEIAFNVEVSAEDAVFLLDGNVLTMSNEAKAAVMSVISGFDGSANFALAVDSGALKLVLAKTVTDGSAEVKYVISGVRTVLADRIVARGTSLESVTSAFPSTVELTAGSNIVTAQINWTHSINTNVPNSYQVTGAIVNLSEIEAEYRVPDSIKTGIGFTVMVQYESDYKKYGSTDYASTGSRWETFGGGKNDFAYYRSEDGYEHMISLVDEDKNQFMPGNTTSMDIDGYSMKFSLLNLKGTSEFKFCFLSGGGGGQHPMEAQLAGCHFALCISKANDAGTQALFRLNYGNYNNSNNHADLKVDVVGIVKDGAFVEAIPFDWTGETEYELRIRVEDGNINMYFVDAGIEYLVVTGLGETETQPAMTELVNARFPDEHDKMYPMIWHETGYDEIVFKLDYHKYVTNYYAPSTKIVDYNTEHGLPTVISATLNNGSVVDIPVTYTGTFDKTVAGDYLLTGTLNFPSDIFGTEGVGETFQTKVTVKSQLFRIMSFVKQENISIAVGETPVLTEKLTVQVKNDITGELNEQEIEVIWTSADFNTLTPGTYLFTANAVGNYIFDASLADDIKVEVTVEKPAGGCSSDASSAAITGILLVLIQAGIVIKRR